MKANLFLLNESFNCSSMRLDEIYPLIHDLLNLTNELRDNGEVWYRWDSLYYEIFWGGYSISDVIHSKYGDVAADERKALMKIIDHANRGSDNTLNIKEHDTPVANNLILGDYPTEYDTKKYYFLTLKKYSDVHIIIESYNDLIRKYIKILSVIDLDAQKFISYCKKYFVNLYFHDRVASTIIATDGGFANFKGQIVKALTALNDLFPKYKDVDNYQRISALYMFSSESGFQTTPQGDAYAKSKMSFDFDGNILCCEPHIKLEESDIVGDTHHYFNRIHFHEGKTTILENKILIGHIGKHLDL